LTVAGIASAKPIHQCTRISIDHEHCRQNHKLMKLACLIFVNSIVLINLIAGIWQAWKLGRLRIGTCRGVITRSEVEEHDEWRGRSRNLRMCSPKVEYTYNVSGESMKGNVISFLRVQTSNTSGTKKRLRRYPVGAQVEVFFNIEQPEQSYLINPRKHIWTTLGVVTGFVLIGYLMNSMIFRWLK
jgi:hypothetical protein